MSRIKESFIKCGHCHHRFRSPIFIADTESFDSATLAGNRAQCPKCGKMVDCNKENMSYVLADELGGNVGDQFGGNRG